MNANVTRMGDEGKSRNRKPCLSPQATRKGGSGARPSKNAAASAAGGRSYFDTRVHLPAAQPLSRSGSEPRLASLRHPPNDDRSRNLTDIAASFRNDFGDSRRYVIVDSGRDPNSPPGLLDGYLDPGQFTGPFGSTARMALTATSPISAPMAAAPSSTRSPTGVRSPWRDGVHGAWPAARQSGSLQTGLRRHAEGGLLDLHHDTAAVGPHRGSPAACAGQAPGLHRRPR